MLFVSVAAFIATAPVLAFHFGTLSFSGIIANLFAVTLMSIAMWISLAGFFMQVCIPPLVPVCMHAAELTVDVMVRCSSLVTILPMSAAHLPAVHPLAYAPYVLFFTGFCTLKPGFSKATKRYFIWAAPSAFVLCAVTALVHASTIRPAVTSFYLKKASVTGIRWPDGKLWLVGTGPEGGTYSTFSRVIGPWMRQNFSRRIDAVIVPGDPCNTVQSLEPLLKNTGVTTVISLSGGQPPCPDFSRFLQEFGAHLKIVDKGVNFSPDSRCACVIMPDTGTPNGGPPRTVAIGMFGFSVTVPDSLCLPSDRKGAVTYVFSKSHSPAVMHAIPVSHPLYRP